MYATKDHMQEALRTAYLPNLPEAVTDLVFRKAWEDGHASGEHEVEQIYEDLAEIAKAAHAAGQHTKRQARGRSVTG